MGKKKTAGCRVCQVFLQEQDRPALCSSTERGGLPRCDMDRRPSDEATEQFQQATVPAEV
jgi:hypothetical protein